MKKLFAYVVAVLTTYIIAVIFVSQFNIAEIVTLGQPVSFYERLSTTLHDLGSMVSLYLVLIALALAIAWLFVGLVLARWVSPTLFLYALAGFAGMVALHQILYLVFGMNPVAATRSVLGLLSQGAAGVVGGWLFYCFGFRLAGNEQQV